METIGHTQVEAARVESDGGRYVLGRRHYRASKAGKNQAREVTEDTVTQPMINFCWYMLVGIVTHYSFYHTFIYIRGITRRMQHIVG